MPYDGPDYQPEENLEERALRHALAFFSDESKWERWAATGRGPNGSQCVGVAMMQSPGYWDRQDGVDFICKCLGIPQEFTAWNRNCPSFAALKAHLKSRIEYYTKQRLSQTYLVIIGPGRQVRV